MTTIAERIARCLPGASFELETLVRLVGVEETESIETASVTCVGRARLLVNPRFVAEYCKRDEHLFLLVMHEMWHVLLGHTTLYPRVNRVQNIAFDALINAGLCRQHPEPEYRGFFERLNPPDVFPHLLLRPPEGWPRAPKYDVPGPPQTAELLKRLYPRRAATIATQTTVEPTYDELLALLLQEPEAGEYDGIEESLLGTHTSPGDAMSDPMNDELFGDVVRRIVGNWPPPPFPLTGRNDNPDLVDGWVTPRPNAAPLRREFLRVIQHVTLPERGGAQQRHREVQRMQVGPGPLPNPADRLLYARRRLIGPEALANQVIDVHRHVPETPSRALVYLDVSGSMSNLLPHLVDLLVRPARAGLLSVMQFSNAVAPMTAVDLGRGRLTTTNGTDINCVLDDLAGRRETRALIVTDGYVGQPPEAMVSALAARGVCVHALLPVDGWERDLAGFATIHHLPELGHVLDLMVANAEVSA